MKFFQMARIDVDVILRRPERLAQEIREFVPDNIRAIEFRADLAGLLVVSMAASYESCVKDVLVRFASKHHAQFAIFTQNNFEKLNSRVNLSDLYTYARTFDRTIHQRFGEIIEDRKKRLLTRTGKDFGKAYGQILSWRHDFAHAGIRNTTTEEALRTHLLAKRVLYSFEDAFHG